MSAAKLDCGQNEGDVGSVMIEKLPVLETMMGRKKAIMESIKLIY